MPEVDRQDYPIEFLKGFLQKPKEVGSIIPSSRFLERRIVRCAGVRDARVVVELGPGTGGTTRALLRAMRPDARLLAIEISPRFVRLLHRERDSRLLPHLGSAAVPGLIDKLGHDDHQVRLRVADALGAIGPAARDALPALRAAMGGKSQVNYALAIERIEGKQNTP